MNPDITMIREGKTLTGLERLRLTVAMSMPAMLAQISSIAMQYIDATMVGRLGADDSAAIGLVATTLWLFWGVCSAMTAGYSVQVAHSVGQKDFKGARNVLRQGIVGALIFGSFMALAGMTIARPLPHWLGGTPAICNKATVYFFIFVAALPLLTLNYLAAGILRCAGNMKAPSMIAILMCALDCLFNFLLIFPTHTYDLTVFRITVPGAGLGVLGAALGTVLAESVCALILLYIVCLRQPELRLDREKQHFYLCRTINSKAVVIAAPMTLEHIVLCSAQIAITMIVAPLGIIAIAANAFAVTAESLCYMPGYGIADAATAIVGQCHGAGRERLTRQFGYIAVGLGMAVMTVTGAMMYLFADEIMRFITPVNAISSLGAEILRIEAWAEPMFAAAIVSYGVFVGTGRTMVPALMNFGSIWIVRVPLSWFMARSLGLPGVWMAMCAELLFRGIIFLTKLCYTQWWRNPNR